MLDAMMVRNPDNTITTDVFRKETHTDHYLQWSSNHPVQQKLRIVRTLMHRANTLIEDPALREAEKEKKMFDCLSSPCAHGTCTDGVASYTCSCENGWTGYNCDQDQQVYLTTFDHWIFYKVLATEPMTSTNLKATCEAAGMRYPCFYSGAAGCTYYWTSDCITYDSAGIDCHTHSVLSSKLCGHTDPKYCQSLDDTFVCWVREYALGVDYDTHSSQLIGSNYVYNMYALCAVASSCEASPCVHGNCTDDVRGLLNYTCTCDSGWEGAHCDYVIDDCASSPCVHGTCNDGVASYTCSCENGWGGQNCDKEVAWDRGAFNVIWSVQMEPLETGFGVNHMWWVASHKHGLRQGAVRQEVFMISIGSVTYEFLAKILGPPVGKSRNSIVAKGWTNTPPCYATLLSNELSKCPGKTTVIVAYAPTEVAQDTDKDTFYDQLQEAVQDAAPHDITVVLVLTDANAILSAAPELHPAGCNGPHHC
ncbi:hypothetical protein Bbelb_292930 [Branchiostoma belcheri]|nr:hypothetical protein Bbelb_292930 [Branchiostoma belcheri]